MRDDETAWWWWLAGALALLTTLWLNRADRSSIQAPPSETAGLPPVPEPPPDAVTPSAADVPPVRTNKATPVVVTAVLGGALYLDLLRDWLLDKTAFGPILLVLLVAAGWIVPATAIVRREQRGESLARWLTWVPRLALFALILLVHLVDITTLQQDGLLQPWVVACIIAASTWSVMYRTRLQRSGTGIRGGIVQGAHLALDLVTPWVAVHEIGPLALGAAYGLGSAPDAENAVWYLALTASGLLATLAMTLDAPSLRSFPRRLALAYLGYTQFLVLLYAPQGVITATNWVTTGSLATVATATVLVSWQRTRRSKKSLGGHEHDSPRA